MIGILVYLNTISIRQWYHVKIHITNISYLENLVKVKRLFLYSINPEV